MAEQKSKLLTTITLNEKTEDYANVPAFDTKDMLFQGEIDEEAEHLDDENNTIEGQSEDSFKLQIRPYQDPSVRKSPREEMKTSNRLNDSHLFKEELNKSEINVRQLRAGSFKSFQGFGDQYTDSNYNDSQIEDHMYHNSRERLEHTVIGHPTGAAGYQGKLSWISDTLNLSNDMKNPSAIGLNTGM